MTAIGTLRRAATYPDAAESRSAEEIADAFKRVGLDHQEHLGPTLADIAFQKCGIFAPNVPIIFSSNSPPDVLT